jgi:hypothetical protein
MDSPMVEEFIFIINEGYNNSSKDEPYDLYHGNVQSFYESPKFNEYVDILSFDEWMSILRILSTHQERFIFFFGNNLNKKSLESFFETKAMDIICLCMEVSDQVFTNFFHMFKHKEIFDHVKIFEHLKEYYTDNIEKSEQVLKMLHTIEQESLAQGTIPYHEISKFRTTVGKNRLKLNKPLLIFTMATPISPIFFDYENNKNTPWKDRRDFDIEAFKTKYQGNLVKGLTQGFSIFFKNELFNDDLFETLRDYVFDFVDTFFPDGIDFSEEKFRTLLQPENRDNLENILTIELTIDFDMDRGMNLIKRAFGHCCAVGHSKSPNFFSWCRYTEVPLENSVLLWLIKTTGVNCKDQTILDLVFVSDEQIEYLIEHIRELDYEQGQEILNLSMKYRL